MRQSDDPHFGAALRDMFLDLYLPEHRNAEERIKRS